MSQLLVKVHILLKMFFVFLWIFNRSGRSRYFDRNDCFRRRPTFARSGNRFFVGHFRGYGNLCRDPSLVDFLFVVVMDFSSVAVYGWCK